MFCVLSTLKKRLKQQLERKLNIDQNIDNKQDKKNQFPPLRKFNDSFRELELVPKCHKCRKSLRTWLV